MRPLRTAAAVCALALATFASPLAADDCAELAALRALYEIRQVMFHPYFGSWDVSSRIDTHLSELRGPLPSGGYRWVRFVRPSGEPPIAKKEHLVQSNQRAGDSDVFEASAEVPFAIRIVVPRKRSLVRGNNEVWVGGLEIRTWVDGEVETETKRIDQWLKPDSQRTFDLGMIADRAEVAVEAGTNPATLGQALVEVHFRQAVAQDDPANPQREGVEALKRLSLSPDPATLDLEIARLESRLFPGIVVTPFTTIVARLREAEKLLASATEEEREKGKKALTEVMKSLPQ